MEKSTNFINKAASAVFIIIIFTVIGKALGMIRETIIAGYFGTSSQTDALNVGAGIPAIFTGIVYSAISTTFIPVYSKYLKEKTKEQCLYFINNIFNLIILTSIMFTIIGLLLAPAMVKAIAPGFRGDTLVLTVRLTTLLFLPLMFLALSNLISAYLQCHGQFSIPAVTGIPANIVSIVCIMIFYRNGIAAVVGGSILCSLVQFAVQLPWLFKNGYRFKPVIDLRDKGLMNIAVLVPPVLIGLIFNQAYIIIDRMLASGLSEGKISALEYANKVNSLVYYIFIVSLVSVVYPALSQMANDPKKLAAAALKVLKAVILVSLPMTAGIIQLRVEIINVLFERGRFNSQSTLVTSIALGCLSLGVLGIGLREVLNKVFYSMNDTKTPMFNSIIAISINILLDILMVRIWGVYGLALATSSAALISSAMLLFRFRNKIGIKYGSLITCLVKSFASSLLMCAAIILVDKSFFYTVSPHDPILVRCTRLGVEIGIGGLFYMAGLYITKVGEFRYAVKLSWIKVQEYRASLIRN